MVLDASSDFRIGGNQFAVKQGEAGDADLNGTEKGLRNLGEILQGFSLKDIWNADQFGLF